MITPAPPIYTPDDLKSRVEADFADRGVSAVVEVGEWSTEPRRGEPRVVIGLGRFTVEEPQGRYQPGAVVPIPGSTDVARPMLDDLQTYRVWVHAPASNRTEDAPSAARRATAELKRKTLAAIRRTLAAPFRVAASGEWPALPAPGEMTGGGYAAYTYGSIAAFDIVIAAPILDDPQGTGTADEIDVAGSFTFPDGEQTPVETIPAS
jgi:hypothetical protein